MGTKACPVCGGATRQTDKNTTTGEDWREFTCQACGHIEDVNYGTALWKVLDDANDNEEREAFEKVNAGLPHAVAAAGKEALLWRLRAVDVFFVAPGDLAQSMSFPGQMDHPKVQAAIDRAPGVLATPATVRRYVERSALSLYVGLAAVLDPGAKDYMAAVRNG